MVTGIAIVGLVANGVTMPSFSNQAVAMIGIAGAAWAMPAGRRSSLGPVASVLITCRLCVDMTLSASVRVFDGQGQGVASPLPSVPVAWEWLGVAGVLGGAGIGGVVTVALQVTQGRQNAKVRAEDRDWSLRDQDVGRRQDLYAEMLDAARRISGALMGLLVDFTADPSGHPLDRSFAREDRQRYASSLRTFGAAAARADVMAVDDDVLVISRGVSEAAGAAQTEVINRGPNATARIRAVADAADELREACRADPGRGRRASDA